jgi:dihydroxyacetone kinase-like protein
MPALGHADIVRMIRAAAAKIRANEQHLSALDSATGDGDHGTTICKVMDAAETTATSDTGNSIAELLTNVGWAVMCVDGGSAPPLLGSFFTGMGEGAAGKTVLDVPALAAALDSGVTAMREHSKAQVGDKTMMDALLPAVEAAKNASDVAAALRSAAEAAARGALATKEMVAKFGRARNLGDRTKGHQDPGATSVSLIFQAFAEAINERN